MILYNQNIWGNTDKPIGNRHILIREMVDEIRPDVVTLQECNPARSRVGEYPMQEMLKPEYLEVLPEKADVNFAPVFYRTETLEFAERLSQAGVLTELHLYPGVYHGFAGSSAVPDTNIGKHYTFEYLDALRDALLK